MARLEELHPSLRKWVEGYSWRKAEFAQVAQAPDPAAARLALISSAGFVLPDMTPFRKWRLGGDDSFRRLPSSLDSSTLINTHRSEAFDHEALDRDPELGLPLSLLKELQEEGLLGSLHETVYSFMGSITRPGRLVRSRAPELAAELRGADVDLALLVPV